MADKPMSPEEIIKRVKYLNLLIDKAKRKLQGGSTDKAINRVEYLVEKTRDLISRVASGLKRNNHEPR